MIWGYIKESEHRYTKNKGTIRFGGLLVFSVLLIVYWSWLGSFKLNYARVVQ